jgi:hypothetical protein
MQVVRLPDIQLVPSKLDTNPKRNVDVEYLLDWGERIEIRKGHQSFFCGAGMFLTSSISSVPSSSRSELRDAVLPTGQPERGQIDCSQPIMLRLSPRWYISTGESSRLSEHLKLLGNFEQEQQ